MKESIKWRGFFTGLTAVLTVLFLSGLLALSSLQSENQVFSLVQLQAFQVSQRAEDAKIFVNDTIEDALLDTAVQAHACARNEDFCLTLQSRLRNYLSSSSTILSQDGLRVQAEVEALECQPRAVAGFDSSYVVTGRGVLTVRSPHANKQARFEATREVNVNKAINRVLVRSPKVEREVQITC